MKNKGRKSKILNVEKLFHINKFGEKRVLRKKLYLECGHTTLIIPSRKTGIRVGTLVYCLKCI